MAKQTLNEVQDDRIESMTAIETRLVNLLALLLVQERPQTTQIDLLGRAGFSSAQIAALIGTTRNTVSVVLSNLRSSKKSKAKVAKK